MWRRKLRDRDLERELCPHLELEAAEQRENGLASLVLSLIGIYGVLSQAVAQRTQEMGVRLALGAKPIEITGLIVGEGLRLTMWGIALGVAGGALASTFYRSCCSACPRWSSSPREQSAFRGCVARQLSSRPSRLARRSDGRPPMRMKCLWDTGG